MASGSAGTPRIGLLVRTFDGTVYFISNDSLRQYRLAPEEQLGGALGDRLQQALDGAPGLVNVLNAIRMHVDPPAASQLHIFGGKNAAPSMSSR